MPVRNHHKSYPSAASWVDMMDADSRELPLLFEELLDVGPGCEDTEGDANSDFLDMDEMEEEEDDSTFHLQQPRPPSASDAVPPMDSDLDEVCKRAASKLGIPWPAAQDTTGGRETCMTVRGSHQPNRHQNNFCRQCLPV